MHNNNRITLLDCPIDTFTMDETVKYIDQCITERLILQHVVINAAKLVKLQRNPFLQQSVVNSDIINPDGQSIVWGAKFLGKYLPERVAGVDLMPRLLDLAFQKNYSIYLLGAKHEIVERVVNTLQHKYPLLKVVGYHHGYFSENEEQKIAETIRNCRPDMLFLGITSPKKEIFLNKYKDYMQVPFSMGVGGTFDILAGKTKRAPVWMQKNGLEWIYRILQEPRRMWKRYLVTNTLFLYYLLKEKLGVFKPM